MVADEPADRAQDDAVDDAQATQDEAAGYTLGTISREALLLLIATGASLAIGFITSVTIARTLGPSGQGVFSALRADAAVITALFGVGGPAALYYYASLSRESRPALVGISFVHAALLGGIAAAIVALFGARLSDAQGAGGDTGVYLLAAILAPAAYLEYSYANLLRAELRFRLANLLHVASRICGLAVAGVLVVALDLGVEGAVLTAVVISLVQSVGSLPALLRGGVRLSAALARKVLSYGLRAQVGLIFRFASLRFDVLFLTFLASPSVVGYYAIAQMVAELCLLVPQSFGWILSPIVTRGGSEDLTRRLLRLNGTASFLAISVMAVVGPTFVVLAYGEAFEPAITAFLILLPGIWLFACGELVSWVLSARGRPGTASWLATYQGVATLALDVALIPPFGLEGAAIASTLAYSSFGILSLALIARHDRVRVTEVLFVRPGEVPGYYRAVRDRMRARWAS